MKFGRHDLGDEEVCQSHPAWGAWIEIRSATSNAWLMWSHPAWGAWIEIGDLCVFAGRSWVAPRMGCVD